MGKEHEPELVWRAMELYCSDRMSFVAVSQATGVADSTLRRWADFYGWREKREEIARAEADLRADKVLARAKTVRALLETPRADLAFAVSSLESLALREAEAARSRTEREPETEEAIPVNSPAEAAAALRRVVEKKLGRLLSRPEGVDLKAVREVRDCLDLIGRMESGTEEAATPSGGVSAELAERIAEAMRG